MWQANRDVESTNWWLFDKTAMVGTNGGVMAVLTRGRTTYELSNHLGNVLVTVSDRKLQVSAGGVTVDYYNADVVTATDYYPFGLDMPGRKYGAAGRYGFNGKERDKDMNSLTAYDYGFRIYNPAIGKFLSVDPLAQSYPWYTPYQFAGNKPIIAIDLDGMEERIVVTLQLTRNKPILEATNSITLQERADATTSVVNYVKSKLQLSELQNPQPYERPRYNTEYGNPELTPKESHDIIEETVRQFVIISSITSVNSETVNPTVVTQLTTITFDFAYSLYNPKGDNNIESLKQTVTAASTFYEYKADISGSEWLNKVSSAGSIISNIVNENYVGVSETITTTAVEKTIGFAAKKWLGVGAEVASKGAGYAVGAISLALTSTAPENPVPGMLEANKTGLRNRTIGALLFYFLRNNKITTKPFHPPSDIDGSYQKPPNEKIVDDHNQ